MNIHINAARINIEINKIVGRHIVGYQFVESLHHRLMEIRVAHVTAIYKKILIGIAHGGFGRAHVARNIDERGVGFERQQLPAEVIGFVAENMSNPLPVVRLWEVVNLGIVVYKCKMEIGIDQCNTDKFGDDVAQLRFVRFKKLTSGRYIEKKVFDKKTGATRAVVRLLTFDVRSGNDDAGAQLILLTARAHFHLSHGSNRSQRFATKTHGAECKKVGSRVDFGGSMSLKSHTCIGFRHAFSVVGYLYQGASGIFKNHLNGSCSGINSILHQLLDNRSRALNYFTGSNLIGYRVG